MAPVVPAARLESAAVLASFGFPLAWCVKALAESGDNIERAAEYILAHQSQLEEQSAADAEAARRQEALSKLHADEQFFASVASSSVDLGSRRSSAGGDGGGGGGSGGGGGGDEAGAGGGADDGGGDGGMHNRMGGGADDGGEPPTAAAPFNFGLDSTVVTWADYNKARGAGLSRRRRCQRAEPRLCVGPLPLALAAGAQRVGQL